jgi:large subunit ribosomal protein L24
LQATLLGAAIAIILALVAALVGPQFVDWTQYRGVFEARASRIVGLPVRVTGAIDARILPSPSVVLRGVEVGEAGKEARLKTRELGIEFGLGPLFRGELRAVDMRVVGPELRLGLDADGRLGWPKTQAGVDSDQFSIDRLRVADGRAVVTDARSGTAIVVEKLSFNGELRSLVGPVKGEGGFDAEGERYAYRVSAGRADGEGAKVKLGLEPSAHQLTIEADGTLRLENGGPAFDGMLAVSRPAGIAPASGRGVAAVPWRASGRVKATSANALFEQLDVQYGPEGRAIKLSGVAQVKLGKNPLLSGVLSAREVDLDQAFDLPDRVRNSPAAAARVIAETIAGAVKAPFPLQLGIGIDSVTLAGSPIHAVRGDFKLDPSGLDIETFEFRAPGATQVRVSGRLSLEGAEATFKGPATIDAADPRAFAAWLEGRGGAGHEQVGPMRASGEVTFGNDRIAIERFKAEIDRKTVEGRLVYAAAAGGRPARLEAELKAAVLDFDRLVAIGRAALAGTSLDLPGETALAIDIGRATIVGIEAKDAAVKLRLDAGGLVLDRAAVSDFGGATFNLSGRIESPFAGPHGAVTLDADARSLDGALALLARFVPDAAETARGVAARLTPLKTHATLTLAAARGAAGPSKLVIEGTAGAVRLRLGAQANGDPSAPAALDTRFDGELAADDGRALVALLGLDRAVVVDKQSGRLTFAGQGVLNGDLRVEAKLAAGGLAASANGTARVFGAEPATATLATTISADVRLPRRGDVEGKLPLAVTSRVTAKPGMLTFDDLAGTIAGVPVRGRLEAGLATPIRIDGQLDADNVNVPTLLASAIGATTANEMFSSEPFAAGAFDGARGRVRLAVSRAALTPALVSRQARANVRLGDGEIALEDIDGELAAGRLTGAVTFRRVADGVAMHGRLALAEADAAALLAGEGRAAVAGKLTAQVEADATGRSPATLIGSLAGTGTVSLAGADIAGFDPDAFNAVIREVGEETTIDAAKVRDLMAAALDRGSLRVERADAAFTIAAGDVRLSTAILHGEGADLNAIGHFNLADRKLDARLTVSAPAPAGSSGGRPEVYVTVRGPLGATQRAVDATTLSAWLTLRAVDREARRIDALEAGRAPALVPTEASPAPTEVPPAPTATTAAPPPAPAPPPVAPPPRRTAPKTRPEASAAPGTAAPALPPPINIRPPASATGTPRPKAPRAAAAPAKAAPARAPVEAPAEERPLLERLFGSQR